MARYVTFVLKLRPSCSSVWNLQGLPRSPGYDRSRDWRSRRQPQQEQDLLQMPAGGPCNYFHCLWRQLFIDRISLSDRS